MHAADRPPGTMPAFVRQVPMAKAMHPDTIIAWDMNGQPIPLPHGVAAARDHSGMGRRVFGEVAERAQRAREGHRQLLGRDRLSLSEPARRARRRGGCEGHGAAHRPRREVADHDAGERRVARRRQDRRSAALRGPARTTSPRSTCRSTTAPPGSRRDSPANRRASPGGGSSSSSTPTKPQSYLILSRATDSKGNMQPAVSQWNPSGYLWNQYDSVRVEVK